MKLARPGSGLEVRTPNAAWRRTREDVNENVTQGGTIMVQNGSPDSRRLADDARAKLDAVNDDSVEANEEADTANNEEATSENDDAEFDTEDTSEDNFVSIEETGDDKSGSQDERRDKAAS